MTTVDRSPRTRVEWRALQRAERGGLAAMVEPYGTGNDGLPIFQVPSGTRDTRYLVRTDGNSDPISCTCDWFSLHPHSRCKHQAATWLYLHPNVTVKQREWRSHRREEPVPDREIEIEPELAPRFTPTKRIKLT